MSRLAAVAGACLLICGLLVLTRPAAGGTGEMPGVVPPSSDATSTTVDPTSTTTITTITTTATIAPPSTTVAATSTTTSTTSTTEPERVAVGRPPVPPTTTTLVESMAPPGAPKPLLPTTG